MPKVIDSFKGDYAFLSNFYMHPVKYGQRIYPSTEHAYQAAKTKNSRERETIKLANTPALAKHIGRKIVLREDWEDIKLQVMTTLIRRKFQDKALRKMLVATGDAELIEGNWWGDTFWGVCRGQGQNMLGKILMKERDRIIRFKKLRIGC